MSMVELDHSPQSYRAGIPLYHRRLIFNPEMIIIFTLTTIALMTSMVVAYRLADTGQQFTDLSRSFLTGRLYLTNSVNIWSDTVWHNEHYYWPAGPLPAFVLMPFVFALDWLSIPFYQAQVQMVLTLVVFILCYWLARHFRYNNLDATYLAFAFCFASVFQAAIMISTSWYFAHVVATVLLLLSLFEYFTKKRYWIIGVLVGFTFMTRATAGLGILFYLTDVITDSSFSRKQRTSSLAQLLVPVIVASMILGGYNFARFENPFDNGYKRANNWQHGLQSDEYVRREYGLFQLINIPTNIYYYFLKGLDPVLAELAETNVDYILKPPYINVGHQGVGFFFVAPIFIYAFRTDWRKRIVTLSLIPISAILLILLTYYWPGGWQIGPRYTLDFLPFAFLVLLFSFPNFTLSPLAKTIIIGSAFFNYFLALLALG